MKSGLIKSKAEARSPQGLKPANFSRLSARLATAAGKHLFRALRFASRKPAAATSVLFFGSLRHDWKSCPDTSSRPTIQPVAARRGRYEGVLEIISYNRGLYAWSAIGVSAGLVIAARLPRMLALVTTGAVLIALAWMLASIAVSHYVYDRSSVYDFRWMREQLPRTPRRWVNIHSGLDQSTGILKSVFPQGDEEVLDIYDPVEMTEPSITRARTLSEGKTEARHADFRHLTLPDSSCDAVFLIFSAHELRRRDSRAQFFKEVARVLAADGRVILMEHLRDTANFLAFGPGCWHFHSRGEWLRAAATANLRVRQEMPITPFVRVFVMEKKHDA
jgi:ubiquinone/menaquinone biosynthesis C-methylase UbiE